MSMSPPMAQACHSTTTLLPQVHPRLTTILECLPPASLLALPVVWAGLQGWPASLLALPFVWAGLQGWFACGLGKPVGGATVEGTTSLPFKSESLAVQAEGHLP